MIKTFWLEDTGRQTDWIEIPGKRGRRRQRIYRDPGYTEMTLDKAPVGAMWDATWLHGTPIVGPDGISLVVKTPGGDWLVDGVATNCPRPKDTSHKCWIRHGDPRTEPVTVDKNGETCPAGGGSIGIGGYHGFLRNGLLTDA